MVERLGRPVVTVSAPYGAGGSVIGPRLADALAVPFVDRAVPAAVAERLRLPLAAALERDDSAPHGLGRLFAAFARVPNATLGPMEGYLPPEDVLSDEAFVAETERVIRAVAASGDGGVLLGRAAAIVLADEPAVLHVRLYGPVQRRVRQAMTAEGLTEEEAVRRQRDTDAARKAYVKTFYGRDPSDPSLYHLMIDSTRLGPDCCVQIITRAAGEAV